MKRVSKLKGLVGKPLQKRYLSATESEREALQPMIDRESEWIMQKMYRKGYKLEATVSGIYGLFTRGAAVGTTKIVAERIG